VDPHEGERIFIRSASATGKFDRDNSHTNSLGARDRGPLVEKYIRELPLEYREMLKAYYQNLAK
jgi:hypothetical protein